MKQLTNENNDAGIIQYLIMHACKRMTKILNTLKVLFLLRHGSCHQVAKRTNFLGKLDLEIVHHQSVISVQFVFSSYIVSHQKA
jgi:hypothetical protein